MSGQGGSAGPAWQAVDAGSLSMRDWDGEHLVFDSSSGDTHLLDESAGQLLCAVCAGAATERSLRQELMRRDRSLDAGTAARVCAQSLAALAELGLIVRGAP